MSVIDRNENFKINKWEYKSKDKIQKKKKKKKKKSTIILNKIE